MNGLQMIDAEAQILIAKQLRLYREKSYLPELHRSKCMMRIFLVYKRCIYLEKS